MRKLKGLLLLLISVLVLNGCIVPQYISYDGVIRDSKSEDYIIKIYENEEEYYEWRKNNPYKMSKEYTKKFKVVEGKNNLKISSKTLMEKTNYKLL